MEGIAIHADISEYSIEEILIRDQKTLVEMLEEHVSAVLAIKGKCQFREHKNATIESN
ncbi:MAG: hypothetical protein N2D54_01355 [Chloroflexota bacterium]